MIARAPLAFALALAALALLATPRRALAQAPAPRVVSAIEPGEVEVGESVTVQLQATAESGGPALGEPLLRTPGPLPITSGPNVSTQTQISIVNGRISRSTGVTVTWRVLTQQPGTFTIPAPSITWGGKRIAAAPLRLTVLPPGSRPRTRPAPTQQPNPFDPFGMLGQMPGWFDEPRTQAQPEAPDPALAVEIAPDPNVFLRAIPDRTSAVVGEQVGLVVYIYSRQSSLQITDVHEPAAPKFFRRDIGAPAQATDAKLATVAGQIWRAQPIFHVALFPLEAGSLEIGPMSVTVIGSGLRGRGARGGVAVQSQPLRIQVGEPPLAGRPAGYQIGDVGRYTLSASVEPRATEVGGAVAVQLELSGTGNVPSALRLPDDPKLEWLEPQTRERFDVQNGQVHGARTFTYIVRPKVAGTLDLGTVRLPYWDPERRAYDVATATLGAIQVAPSSAPAASAEPPKERDPFAALGPVRTSLGPVTPRARPPSDHAAYWLALFGAPLAIAVAQAGTGLARRIRARREEDGKGPRAALARAEAELSAAEGGADARAVLGALERLLYATVDAHVGVRARGLLRDELAPALAARGVGDDLAARVRAALDAIDSARFAPEGGASSELRAEVRAIAGALRRRT